MGTGDLAVQDKAGYTTIWDRLKEIIVRGGENISCAEVEDAVYKHSGVSEAAVLGLPHDRLGEEVTLVVVLAPCAEQEERVRSASMPSKQEFTSFLAARLAKFKVPSRIFVWPDRELPHGATGETLKRDLKRMISEGKPGIVELQDGIASTPPTSRL